MQFFWNQFLSSSLLGVGFLLFIIPSNLRAGEDQKPSSWELYKQTEGVKIYYQYKECRNDSEGIYKEYVVLRFENTTHHKLYVSWKNDLWYEGECKTCGDHGGEYRKKVILPPNKTKSGSCKVYGADQNLRIFSRFLNRKTASLTKFELNRIGVTKDSD